jgi:hypothetical protein
MALCGVEGVCRGVTGAEVVECGCMCVQIALNKVISTAKPPLPDAVATEHRQRVLHLHEDVLQLKLQYLRPRHSEIAACHENIAVSAELHKHYVAVGRTIRTVSLRWNVWYVIHCHSCGGVWCVGIRSPSTS